MGVQKILSAPRIFLIIPGLLAGFLIPNLLSSPSPVPFADVGMVTRDFGEDALMLHRGEGLNLSNAANAVHVIGPGQNTYGVSPQHANPMPGFHLMQTNSAYT